jgi:hypothetical protein
MRVMMLSKVYIIWSAFGHNIIIVLLNKPDLLQTCKIVPAIDYTIHDFMLICNNYNSRCTWNMLSTPNKKFRQPPIDSILQIVDKFQNSPMMNRWCIYQPFLFFFIATISFLFLQIDLPQGQNSFPKNHSLRLCPRQHRIHPTVKLPSVVL